MSEVRRIKRWRTEIGTDDTEFVTLPASDYDALAARLAEAERRATTLQADLDRAIESALKANAINTDWRRDWKSAIARAEAAEARVRELEDALGRGSIERCVQCAGHGYLLSPRQGRFECENCDEKGFVLMRDGRKVTLSARAVQEPACQHDLQQSAPTVRVWHSIFEPEKQSAECNVCGSRWTLNGVGRG